MSSVIFEHGMKLGRFSSYAEYMQSDCWRYKRIQRLWIDKKKCRTCHSTKNLEVHHANYDKPFGEESIEDDLITLCDKCHDAISKRLGHGKYSKKPKSDKPDTKQFETMVEQRIWEIRHTLTNYQRIFTHRHLHDETQNLSDDNSELEKAA